MDFYDSRMLLKDKRDGNCGNKVLYSCMFRAVGGYCHVVWDSIVDEMGYFIIMKNELILTVRKHDDDSPDSLDNLFGFIYSNLLTAEDLKRSGWYINGYNKNEHTWIECFKVMWKYRKEMKADRNYWHENGLDAVGKIANLVPPHIRHYANKKAGKFGLINAVMFYLWLFSVLIKSNFDKNDIKATGAISQKNIAWLILKDLNNPLHKLVNHKTNMNDYFEDEDHPIRRKINESAN